MVWQLMVHRGNIECGNYIVWQYGVWHVVFSNLGYIGEDRIKDKSREEKNTGSGGIRA